MKTLWLLAWLSGDGEHKGGLLDIDPGLMIWTIIIFILLLILLGKLAWKPIIKTLQEREEKIKNSLDQAEKARRDAEQLIAKNEEILSRANREAQDIMKKAKEEAEKLRFDYAVKAKEDSDKMVASAKKEIENEKNTALMHLKNEIAGIAVEAAGKVIGANLDADKHKKLIDDFIKELPVNKN
ncbi:F0F1 ATP synthase subunit B [bacterium]|nr:F0F1 ATP synthase subunit B [bacterium]